MSETDRLFRNTLMQSAPVFTTFVFSFILAPIMLSRLGLAQFGVWAVTGALAQYARLLDFGITGSAARFVALFDAEGNRRAIEETTAIGLLAAAAVSLVMLVAAVVLTPVVVDAIGTLDTGEMRLVLVCSVGITASNLFGAVLAAVPIGLRRMGPPNLAGTIGNVVNFLASLVALLASQSLGTYAIANLAAAAFALLLVAISVVWVWPRPYVRRPHLGRARELVSFGIKSQLVTLANLVNVQTDKIIIATILGARTAGAYEIGNRVVQGVLSLGMLSLSALIPTATADLVKRGRTVIVEYLIRYTTRSLAIALPMFGAVCVSIPYLLVAWLNEIPPESVQIIILLSFSFAVSLVTGVAMTLVVSDGNPGLVAQTATLVVVLNLGGTLIAAPIFGLWGVLIGTVMAEILASAVFLVRFHRRYELRMAPFWAAVGRPAAVSVLLAVPFALWYLLGGPIASSRPGALVGLVCTGGLYLVGCVLIESGLGLLPERLRLRRAQ
jgi:O-antigen/teichoic acid export membrane protein